MSPRLVVITGPREGWIVEVEEGEPFVVGRRSGSALSLPDGSVSRRHCELTWDGERLAVRDLDSRHGTFVNRLAVGERELAHGDLVQVGGSQLLVLLREAPPGGDSDTGAGVRLDDADFTAESTVLRSVPLLDAVPPLDAAAGPADASSPQLPAGAPAAQLKALLRLARAIDESNGAGALARRVAALVAEVVPAERTAVLFVAPGGGEPEIVHAASRGGGEGEVTVSRTLVRRVLETRRAILASEFLQLRADAHLAGAASLDSARLASVACVPLAAGNEPLGVLYADTADRQRRFHDDHLEVLCALAAFAGAAFALARRVDKLERERRRLADGELDHGLVGDSGAMRDVLTFVSRAAPVDSTVLVTGESGTGKELVSRALHVNSERRDGPFVAVNCAVLSETLLASELFGHEKGAFTGAVAAKPGKLELADGGTLFLDEIGEMAPQLQAQLLRFLEDRRFERVGGTRQIEVDVRVVAATNRDLPKAIDEGDFRRDLYYRLNVLAVALPPLRDRRGDVPLLARHFAARFADKLHRPVPAFSERALAALAAYSWPGNVREMANVIERAVVLGGDGAEGGEAQIGRDDLPEEIVSGAVAGEVSGTGADGGSATTYHAVLTATKKRLVLDAVRAAGGNVTKAAEQLDLHPNYLHRLITQLELRDQLDR